MKRDYLLYGIMILNVLIFLAQLSGWDMRPMGALYSWQSGNMRWWQWFSHMFLHENLMHLLLNMYAIYFFGQAVLSSMRMGKFILLCALGGLSGAFLYELTLYFQIEQHAMRQTLVSGSLNTVPRDLLQLVYAPMLGSSGVAFAILGAFAVRFPNAPLGMMFLPFHFRARYFVLAVVGYEIFAYISDISLFGDNIAHMAHVGGALMGGGVAWLWRKRHINLLK